jgi:hypothetical protein
MYIQLLGDGFQLQAIDHLSSRDGGNGSVHHHALPQPPVGHENGQQLKSTTN